MIMLMLLMKFPLNTINNKKKPVSVVILFKENPPEEKTPKQVSGLPNLNTKQLIIK